jgi:hypothetical protein
VDTQTLTRRVLRDHQSASTFSALEGEIIWADLTDQDSQGEQSPTEILSVGPTGRRHPRNRERPGRARLAWLCLLAVVGAVLCIKIWPTSSSRPAVDPQPTHAPTSIAGCSAHTCTEGAGAPASLARVLRSALPKQQPYRSITTRDARTGHIQRIQIDTVLPGHVLLRIGLDRPTQEIATPTPWTLTADGNSPRPSHAGRRLISPNGCALDVELEDPTSPASPGDLPTALAEQVAEAVARAAPGLPWV